MFHLRVFAEVYKVFNYEFSVLDFEMDFVSFIFVITVFGKLHFKCITTYFLLKTFLYFVWKDFRKEFRILI